MSLAQLSTRLPRIEAGPFVSTSGVGGEDDWSEIEALLASPEPLRGRRKRSRSLRRALAGVAALVATGGLALAGLSFAERGGLPASLAMLIPSPTMAVAPSTQVASAPAHATMEEGRSVATAGAAGSRGTASPGAVASADPVADRAASTDAEPGVPPALRHRHRRKH